MKKSVVVLVHGTFAYSASDDGPAWWQNNGKMFRAIQNLSGEFEILKFRWTGENTERAREAAAKELLSKIEEFEEKMVPYYLIGHSHGGSVIWRTLLIYLSKNARSSKIDRNLNSLQRIVTVGTPFISCESDVKKLMSQVAYWYIFLILLGNVAVYLIMAAYSLAGFGRNPSFWLFPLCLLMINFLGALGSVLLEHYFFKSEDSIKNQIDTYLKDKIIILYHEHDEAITGLTATIYDWGSENKSGTVTVPNLKIPFFVYKSDWMTLLTLPWPIVLKLIKRLTAKPLRKEVYRMVQGLDRPGIKLTSIAPFPKSLTSCAQTLPDSISTELQREADTAASNALCNVRATLCASMLSSGSISLPQLTRLLTFRELIHTTYFDCNELVNLIAFILTREVDVFNALSSETITWLKAHFPQLLEPHQHCSA